MTTQESRANESVVVGELNKGYTVPEIAEYLQVSRTYVYKIARRNKLPLNKPIKVPSPKARRIYEAVTPAMSPSMVARVFRITPTVVSNIVTYYKEHS